MRVCGWIRGALTHRTQHLGNRMVNKHINLRVPFNNEPGIIFNGIESAFWEKSDIIYFHSRKVSARSQTSERERRIFSARSVRSAVSK